MGFGLFGKLPQKRDFVAFGVPRSILEPFETWLQSAVAASRSELGNGWQERYLVSPIWRFWIGRDILGTACSGALMPSVDRVGRFFPLAILFSGEGAEEPCPPAYDPQEEWFAAIEAKLLSVLDDQAAIDPEKLTDGLEAPVAGNGRPEHSGVDYKRGTLWSSENGHAADLLSALIAADYWVATAGRSFWWTNGSTTTGPLVYTRNALPDPFFYTTMIKGEAS